jgi:hypothetical protein
MTARLIGETVVAYQKIVGALESSILLFIAERATSHWLLLR